MAIFLLLKKKYDFHEQHVFVCVCVSNFNLGETFSEASATLTQAFSNESMSQTEIHDCTNGLNR
jgi:hypothetical protein